MFRAPLEEKLKKIFGFEKTTYADWSDSFEQDTLFIKINDSKVRASSKSKAHAKVTGELVVFSQDNKMPYGFFAKRIENAKFELTKDIYFFNIDVNNENSPARLQNIYERHVSFVFFFTAQYDPNRGELTTLEMEEV